MPLQQQRVAGREDGLVGPEVLALALDGEDDEVAALGDHAGEGRLADEAGAGRDDDLGDAGLRG